MSGLYGFCICGHQARSHGADLGCGKCACRVHTRPSCSVEGCDLPILGLHFCNSHKLRARRHGDPLAGGPSLRRAVDERFWEKVNKTETCWLWTGVKDKLGYARFKVGSVGVMVHRWSYESLVGPIPAGLELDHLCRVRNCVNPAHLEAVTHRVNSLRGDTVGARHAAQTHCLRGHLLPESKGGERRCAPCAYERNKRYEARKRVSV